ncbi:hypothetical protein D3C87_1320050 [compost metagenome]
MKIKFRHPESSTKILFRKIIFSALCLFLVLSSSQSFAVNAPTKPAPETDWEEALIQGNINISNWFDSFADGLDLFLVGKRVTERRNETQIEIENSAVITEKEDFENSVNFGINLRLPNVEEYWNVKFTSYDEQEEGRDLKNAYLRQTPRQKNYGATIGLLAKLGNVRTTFEPRIELQDPLKVSHTLTFESVAETRGFEFNPKLQFYADSSDGLGTTQSLNFHFRLNTKSSITLTNQGDYQEKIALYSVLNGITYGRELSKISAISFSLLLSSENRPNYHLEAYNISTAYTRVLYRNILTAQFIPNVDFSETYGFERVLGLTVNLNLFF